MKIKSNIGILVLLSWATLAGAQTVETVTTNGLFEPYAVAVDLSTNVYYFTDSADSSIMRYDTSKDELTTLVTFLDVTNHFAGFPQGIVLSRGGLVVSDYANHALYQVSFDGDVTVLAGGIRGFADGGLSTARFNSPSGLAVDDAGNIYIADVKNSVIRRLAPDDTVTTFAKGFYEPAGVAVGNGGQLYVTDTRNHTIKVVQPDGSVSLIAGRPGYAGADDGVGSVASFNAPRGLLWVGGDTGLLVSDSGNNTIRRVYFKAGQWRVETFAGLPGEPGYANGDLIAARFNSPLGLAVDGEGSIVLADLYNNALRRIKRVVPPLPLVSPLGGSFSNAVSIAMTSAAPNTLFYYTTDGTAPNPLSFSTPANLSFDGGPVILAVRGVSPDFATSGVVSNNYSFFVDPLTLSIIGGTFTNDVALKISTLTSNAVIRVTTDGSVPQTNSPVWSDRVLSANGPLVVRGFREGYAPTPAVSNYFNFVVAVPTITPSGATTNDSVLIALTTDTLGANLYWTIDKSDPTTGSTLYTGPFLLQTNGTLKVKGFKNGYTASAVASADFNLTVSTPTIVPAGVATNNAVTVAFIEATPNAKLYWTIDGTEPTPASTLYSGPFTLGTNGTLKVKGFRNGFVASATASADFNFTAAAPVISPASAASDNVVTVTLASVTLGADIYWTIDGNEPSTASARYTAPFSLAQSGTLKAKAFKAGFVASATTSGDFHFTVATPVVKPSGAASNNPLLVTVTSTTAGAQFFWTIDGSDPSPSNGTPYTAPFTLATNGTFKVRGFRNGFADSQIASAVFNLTTGSPVISPNGAISNDVVPITLASPTVGAQLFWTIDGSEPTTTSTLYAGTFSLGTNGTLKVKAFRDGFVDSTTSSANFNLTVSAPIIAPGSAASDNAVNVALASATPGARLFWTIDGAEPTSASTLYAGPFALGTNGTLKVKAFKNGFVDSATTSGNFSLIAAPPVLTPTSGTNINTVTVAMTTRTANANLYFTTDGSEPSTNGTRYATPLSITTNTTIKVAAFRDGFVTSPTVAGNYFIQVDRPVLSPGNGFFPNGTTVTFSVARADASLYYTLNGQDPTTDDTLYTGPFQLNQVFNQGADLRIVKVRAFAPDTLPSAVASGQPVPANALGFPRDVIAGIGSTVVVPVVVNLQTNQVLRSLQFRIEVSPSATAPKLSSDLRALNITSNDFVQVVGPGASGAAALLNTSPYQTGNTKGLIISAIGTNANFAVRNFATVAMLAINVPAAANVGDQYQIDVLQPSGTSDGQQAPVKLASLGTRSIIVSNISYVVGDSSLGAWYNAGDFGDGNLDNSDVNNAFYASLGVRVPYAFTDVFDAMDAFPDDTPGAVGGDGQIRFLDWQRILSRSLRRDPNNWRRTWSPGGARIATTTTLNASPNSPAESLAGKIDDRAWNRQAVVSAGLVENAKPGGTVEVPVYVKVRDGHSLAGMQFRSLIESDGPSLEQAAQFVAAIGLPRPLSLDGLPVNQVAGAWPLVPAPAFRPALQDNNLLGHIRFTIPATATAGTCYTIRFANVDGAPDANTQYDLETLPGCVWIGTTAGQHAAFIPDEWRTKFFGSVTNPLADANADADGDGVPNWQEFLNGTNPTKLRLQVFAEDAKAVKQAGFKLRWFGVTGKHYVIECASDLAVGKWQAIASGLPGADNIQEFTDTNITHRAQFYRVREQQP
ncbi:MAG: chitobiase/beta-hexosaminidase C-terminal domain-containing protein [Verrucomicrobia bacterium]|nr:chitobiase/beta-hexosaminidase C-terminal domain-containing protein [Verrucomicrobiota bacterium]